MYFSFGTSFRKFVNITKPQILVSHKAHDYLTVINSVLLIDIYLHSLIYYM